MCHTGVLNSSKIGTKIASGICTASVKHFIANIAQYIAQYIANIAQYIANIANIVVGLLKTRYPYWYRFNEC